jgi:hypothetical protein
MSFFLCLRVSLIQMPSMPCAKTLAVLVRPSEKKGDQVRYW